MNLADWIHRSDIRGAPGVQSFRGVLEAAFPEGHPHRGLIPRFLETLPGADRDTEAALPHLTLEGPLTPELIVVLVPEGVLVGDWRIRLQLRQRDGRPHILSESRTAEEVQRAHREQQRKRKRLEPTIH